MIDRMGRKRTLNLSTTKSFESKPNSEPRGRVRRKKDCCLNCARASFCESMILVGNKKRSSSFLLLSL